MSELEVAQYGQRASTTFPVQPEPEPQLQSQSQSRDMVRPEEVDTETGGRRQSRRTPLPNSQLADFGNVLQC
jgi:hypothetical protein